MAKNCRCHCSALFSCFSCFSASNTNPSPAQDGTVELLDTQTLSASPHVSISHGLAADSSGSNAVNANTNAASPNVVTQKALITTEAPQTFHASTSTEKALVTGQDPETVLPAPHSSTSRASSSAVEEASSAQVPAVVNQDNPGSDEATKGCSSSSSLQTLSDAHKDAATAEGDKVNVDLDGLIQHISELLKQIKDDEKKSSVPKVVQRYLPYLPTSSSFFKLKEFFSEATNFLKDIFPGDARTIARGLLQNMGTAHLATTGLLVVANILERFEEVSHNRDECLHLLKEMIFLAKVVKHIKERPSLPERMHDEVKDATELIVEASIKCCSQIASSKFSKFFSTSVNKEELGELAKQLETKYKHIHIEMGMEIYDVIQCQKANLNISRLYPEHAVGLEEAIREVIDLLEWGSEQNAVAVILHGFGGMGKTTLADAVFSVLNVEGCQYSKIQLFDNIDSVPKIIELQKLILKDLKGSENIPEIRSYQDGQRELSRVLEGKWSFIYIDNALGERELGHLLPEDMTKAKKVRLLITARDLNVRKACPLKLAPKEYSMRGISSMDATNLLKVQMSGENVVELKSYQVNHIIRKCGGIPLMLKLVAGALRVAEDKPEVDEVLDELEKLKGEDFGPSKIESYFFAYDKLPEECKDPFLDICSFFEGWDWHILVNILGDRELKMLARRALINKDTNGMIRVHDVILTLGRRKSEGVRFVFTNGNQFRKLLDQKTEEEVQNIKGIWFSENRDLLSMPATILDSMHKSLRILRLGKLIKIEGRCSKIFENLIFFQGVVPRLPFGVRELPELKYLCYQPEDLKLLEIPWTLRHMEFDGKLHSRAFEISSRDFEPFKELRILRLTGFEKLEKLPEQAGDLVNSLEELTLSYCKSLRKLPPSISKLQHLRVLRVDYCRSLSEVPEGLGSLNSLQELNFQGCRYLSEIPTSLENLLSLRSLDLSSCQWLMELPRGIENLTSLVNLSFNNCPRLRFIPESIGRLKSSAFSMDMSGCSSLRELPELFLELGNLRELNLFNCRSLEKLPKGFSQLKYLVKLNLSKCRNLTELSNEFHCLLSLESLDMSGCKNLKELPPDFHHLKSLQNLYLSGCKRLRNLTEDFHTLPSLQHLYLCNCLNLEGKWMDNLVKLKTLQIMNIQESNMLVKRWGEIQTEGNQSCSFVVYTGQDLSKEEKKNILQKLLSELDCLLIDKQGRPFHLCDLPPNSLSLVMFHSDPNDDFPFPLIEESIDDIEINLEMIYIGKHYSKLPRKVKDRILAHSREMSEVLRLMVVKLLLTLDAEVLKSWLSTLQKYVNQSWLERYITEEPICFRIEMMEDGNVGKYHSCWKVLSNQEMEEFMLSKSRRYLKLRELNEKTQESNIFMLRELFPTGDEETNHIFQKNFASSQDPAQHPEPSVCGVEKLIGKRILLEMRSVDVCDDARVWSLREMYLKEKERPELEIISVPIVQTTTELDVVERFSKEVPWLVLQNPWRITRAVKYFLVKQVKQCGTEMDGIGYPGLIWIIEPNGEILACKSSVLVMLNRWGPKAYPFTHDKFEELRNSEWSPWKNMSSIEFIFNHLESVSDQVKKMMFEGKVICLYRGDDEGEEATDIIRNALIEERDSIHIIYIPLFTGLRAETLKITDNISKQYHALKRIEMVQAEMEGMSMLNLSEYEAMRFWMRLFYLTKEINEMDNSDNHFCEMKRLLNSIQCYMDPNYWEEEEEDGLEETEDSGSEEEEDGLEETDDSRSKEEEDGLEETDDSRSKEEEDGLEKTEHSVFDLEGPCMIFMDKDGKRVACCKEEIMKVIFGENREYKAKRWMQLLIKALREEGKRTDDNCIVPNDPENVDVDFDSLSEYTSHLLEVEILYHIFEFKKEGKNWSRRRKFGQLYNWPTSKGFSMYKDLLTDGANANWVKDTISQHPEEDNDDICKIIRMSLVNEIGEQHWGAAGLLAIAHVLERQETVNGNGREYQAVLLVLDEIYECAGRLNEFKETTGLTKKMNLKKIMLSIVSASFWCCARTDFSKFSLFVEGRVTLRKLHRIQGILEAMCISFVMSIIRGDPDDNDESEDKCFDYNAVSEDESLDSFSEDESELSSVKASPIATPGDEYLAFSSTTPNISDDNDESQVQHIE